MRVVTPFKSLKSTSSSFKFGLACIVLLCTVVPFGNVAFANSCFTTSKPVIGLNFGSRYTSVSKTRSDIDEASNRAVDEALKPIDKFIQDISREANAALSDANGNADKASCVFDAILTWSKADALSDMGSMTAKIAVPSRIGGIAVAYGQVRGLVPDRAKERLVIESWLKRRALETKTFFDTKAPKRASRNNLRAWASFAVGEVGILTDDASLVAWAKDSNKVMIAQSSPDGSLPLEMERGKYALHYQIHALGPLVTSMARLCDAGHGSSGADLAKLRKIAEFTIASIYNSQPVANLAKAKQVYASDPKKLAGSLAWLEPYSALTADTLLFAKSGAARPMLNSKLGGDLTRLYGGRRTKCPV
jgi:poly(beta-D-mannuronate) lyase